MIYGVIDERGKITTKLNTADLSRVDSACKPLTNYSDWQLANDNLFTWDFQNNAWITEEFPPEPPPVDPNQQWHDQLAIAGFTEEQITKIIAIG